MYSLKPILVEQTIELPNCMFKLNPVNMETTGNTQSSINNSVGANFLGKYFVATTIDVKHEILGKV
jgi:hypothetical protein